MFFFIRHGHIRLLCTKLQKKNLRRKAIKGLQITRETDYAIRTVLYLSAQNNYTAKAEDISKQMQIPKSFLMKILKQLDRAGLVILKRGVTGGVTLSKNPEKITLYDVIVAIEKTVALNRCVINKRICGLVSHCPVHPVWFKIKDRLIQELKEINFAKVLAQETVS
ncbi:MAG: RrF2 family transcriptional regulator [Thermodesulfovibrio sp.]|uniref:Rrf2 family transcriptional regulator n=2 Tax=Thermodesulfovibrio TaxID=28261 RepID=A0A2J6WM58_9BACT|nr:MAG: Rrf2 family transcriptional regulator [Thermodesulfovibrio aggregans]